ncbi:HlyD family efflux transporter periplasmic adaptor subunit [Dyella tabacisoli]|uniref:HlyD family efflux transporter periplasmic adaptor subunit n=1 Tax=Dyella tabacisoli TaxID=2282381 RepID=A0A369URK8_9GAMM|nr:HlyD family efflux transporter periplasmic adaptor subunit [Dyella tabacisoli]RDD83107.1 HlyD family efflux transporter periplasmic adaptor subunit [Dyella tabacisoli]
MSALPPPAGRDKAELDKTDLDKSSPDESGPVTDPRLASAHAPSAWEQFLLARSSDVFCRAWLALICEKFPAVRQGAVLIEASDGQSYVPIAVWPLANADMARMGGAVQLTLAERRVAVQAVEEQPGLLHVAVPIAVHERIGGAVVLEVAMERQAIQPLLREMHWGSAWLTNLLGKRELDQALESNARSMGILETIATTLRHTRFQQALFDLCNELRRRFDASRVAIGLVHDAKIRLVALSEAATFEKSSPLVQAYTDAMGETCDLAQVVHARKPETSDGPVESYRAHSALLQRVGADALLSLPVSEQARTVAVLTLERTGGEDFSEAERRWLETFAALFAPVLTQRVDAERSSLQRMRDEVMRFWGALLGPRYLLWKLAGIVAFVCIALAVFLPVSYRVSAKTVTEGAIQRVAAAPFEGYLAAGLVRAGDTVRKGQVLAQLDDHELLVERAKWASERDQYDNKLREAMANHELSAIQVTSAQLQEAQAQLDLLEDKLARVRVLAPYDGVVVSGDLSQQIGTPVEAGKKLFEIAPLGSYRIILQVDERDIAQVQTGQTGELVMSGLAGKPMPFSVAKIMPVATAQDGKNFYRVEAKLQHDSPLLLPGMEGVGKIGVGRRQLGWVLLHSTLDWLRLTLWNWGL